MGQILMVQQLAVETYKMCKPCTIKCKCKAKCNNPHNDGGECPVHQSLTLRVNKMRPIPIVLSSNRDDFDTESESDEDQNAIF